MCGLGIHAVLLTALLTQPSPEATVASTAERCAEAIGRIRSYDVAYSVESFDHVYGNDPSKPNLPVSRITLEKRDVFAVGLGRRVEEYVGTDRHQISVIDWQTAGSHGPISSFIAYTTPGNGYLDLFNPDCWGLFLADVLRDKKTTTRILGASSPPSNLIGLELQNPAIRGPVRVWADPDHGFMPSVIEAYFVDKDSRARLLGRSRVKEFTQIGGGAWAPIKATYEHFALDPDRIYGSELFVVNVPGSSWNSVVSDELFTAASMPAVNKVRPDGYKTYFPPSTLAEVTQLEGKYRKIVAEVTEHGRSSRLWVFLAVNISALMLLLTAFFLRRMHRRRKVAAAK